LFATLDAPFNLGFNTRFGERVGASDIDADGTCDVLASDDFNNIFIFKAPLLSEYHVIGKPPVDGLPPSLVSGFGEVYVCALDVNGDSLPDILTADAEGISEGCGLLGKEGQLYMALSPYFATFYNLSEPVPACGDGFSTAIAFGQLDQDAAQEAVVGAATSDVLFQNAGVIWLFGTP
jgi:hypothetical protein